jgi:hypothetical protein
MICSSSNLGGAIYYPVENTGQVTCKNCLFQLCSAGGGNGGGAICCSVLNCSNCNFICCTAPQGGAITAPRANDTGDATKTITVKNCDFISCSSSNGDGGAIDIRCYNFHMSGCGFINF